MPKINRDVTHYGVMCSIACSTKYRCSVTYTIPSGREGTALRVLLIPLPSLTGYRVEWPQCDDKTICLGILDLRSYTWRPA